MSIKLKIDKKLARWYWEHTDPPMRIVLSRRAIEVLMDEQGEHSHGIFTCLECGNPVLTYASCSVEAWTDEDVMIE